MANNDNGFPNNYEENGQGTKRKFSTSENIINLSTDSDNENYEPTLDHMMQENIDIGFETDESVSSGTSRDNEINELLKESDMPIEDLLKFYEKTPFSNDSEGPEPEEFDELDVMDPDRKRRKFAKRNYLDFFSDTDEMIINGSRKTVPIGPHHQMEVPEASTYPPLPPSSEYEQILWDPMLNPNVELSDFFAALNLHHPLITFEDESVMELYMKHKGDIKHALKDKAAIEKITSTQASPLTNWSVEECLDFKNAMLHIGKRFELIQQTHYPHKTIKSVVEFYYIWKKSPLFDEYLRETVEEKQQRESFSLYGGMDNPIDNTLNGTNSKSSNESESAQYYNIEDPNSQKLTS